MALLGHRDPVYELSALERWSQPVDATLYLKGEMECALMGRRFHRGFTAAEKAELRDRWKRGESLKAIGRAFGKPSSSILGHRKGLSPEVPAVLTRFFGPAT